MRKDVKLGFAVGGVLLAVLIVYVLVVPGGTSQQAQTNNNNTGEKPTELTVAPAATPTPVAQTPLPDPFEAPSAPGIAPAQPEQVAGAKPANGDYDWNKILTGDSPLTLMTPTPAGANAIPAASTLSPTPPAPAAQTPIATQPPAVEPPAPVAEVARPQAPVAPAQALTGARSHVIQNGETLSSISLAAYGSANFYPAILRANPKLDPTRLKVGTTIQLPDAANVKPEAAAAAPNAVAAPIDSTRQYRVQPNDSLYKISVKLYGKSDRADKLYELNKATIGSDPARLKLNMVLQLPEPPTVASR